ncbi:tRNA (adenosine(37)-N6)-dimethylallyltransferase MiaA [Bacillus thermotolerans]|uniref:tRNA dimethylallyltransferase n=1 Tax=Bacillus thermotolerans TaxID=1221996 RepID=A0A0F5IA04_BACTR|nr:tRNA (adenosine(37)-N6)-dimethylallyltransferase MiaA [Bacillus thermotolerans]KKB38889.1 tRNA dimethylallyltransferase [Bacillus thermotolerans]KKB42444.1 tRNA dimethylallyltransferase [Bacillus thermotolerans]KKB44609.1 tRNA dimethylallyltransferase [Bacillus thermotolerans]
MQAKEKLVVIIGPTAVGKTALSIHLAKKFGGEIISGDSMQVYKGMDIGTAKITSEEMQDIPHHLIDIKEPDEAFSAAEFQQLVRKTITDITNRGALPIIVGGTGLYVQSVIYDYQFAEQGGDPLIRKELEEEAERIGKEAFYEKLKGIDPEAAASIHPNNVRRVVRALEVYYTTGEKMSRQQTEEPELLYDAVLIGLTMEREQLYQRINKRVDIMMQNGLLEEVTGLWEKGIRSGQAVQAIGYKEIFSYLKGEASLEEAVEQLKQNSRNYAKRQLTWFRNKMPVNWFDLSNKEERMVKIQQISDFIAGKLQLKENK